MPLHAGEKVSEGLDKLQARMAEYFKLGARFAKWRAVITIGKNIPSHTCIYANAHALARYAATCQEASIVPMIQSGRFRGLAVSGKARWKPLPDLPTINEVFPGYEMTVWHAWFAPAGVPQPILERLRREINEVLREPEVVERLSTSGSGDAYITTPDEFMARIRADYDKLGKILEQLEKR